MDESKNPGLNEEEREILSDPEDRRLHESTALVAEGGIERGEPGEDKVFFAARITHEGNVWYIDIPRGTPTIALNNKVAEEFGLSSPTVGQIRKREDLPGLSLVSGGVFMWVTNQGERSMILIRRDDRAPVDKLALTGPAGRGSEVPSKTATMELNEELVIVKKMGQDGRHHHKLVGFFRESEEQDTIMHERLRRIETNRVYIRGLLDQWEKINQSGEFEEIVAELKNKLRILSLIQGPLDILLTPVDQVKVPGKDEVRVITRIDGQVIDEIANGFAYFDDANNTLEVREIMQIPPDWELEEVLDGDAGTLYDAGGFDPEYSVHKQGGREITIMTPEQASQEPKVPTLDNYLEYLKHLRT